MLVLGKAGLVFVLLTMASIEAAKQEHTTAKRLFTRTKNGLSYATDKQDDLEIIENRFMDLKVKFSKVQEKHEIYASLLDSIGEEFDEEEEDTWINEIELVYDDMERRKVAYVRAQNKTEEKKMKFESNVIELEAHDKKEEENGKAVDKNKNRTLEEFSFSEEAENLNRLLDSEQHKTNPAIDVIEGAEADLKKQFERCKEAQRQLITILDIPNGQEEIIWMKKIHKIYSQVSLKVGIFMQNHKRNTKLAISKNETSAGQGIRLEHMKMPVFDEDIRDYPGFKSDFLKQVVPEMKSKDSTAYVLRSCLTKILLDIVKNLDDDLDEMWKRLDEKYGKPSKTS